MEKQTAWEAIIGAAGRRARARERERERGRKKWNDYEENEASRETWVK